MKGYGGIFSIRAMAVDLGELPGDIAVAGYSKFMGDAEVPAMVSDELVGSITMQGAFPIVESFRYQIVTFYNTACVVIIK